MRTLLWAILILYTIKTVFVAIYLTADDYPREVSYSRGEDVLGLILSVLIVVGLASWIFQP